MRLASSADLIVPIEVTPPRPSPGHEESSKSANTVQYAVCF